MSTGSSDWQTRCAERRAKQLEQIPKEWIIDVPPKDQRNVLDIPKRCGLLTPRELEITDTTDVDLLLSRLTTGVWTSVEVTLAFYKRAIIAHQVVSPHAPFVVWHALKEPQTNCLTEIFVERALARAREMDEALRTTGKVVGPLHGLPVSLKDQFCMKGLETIMGQSCS